MNRRLHIVLGLVAGGGTLAALACGKGGEVVGAPNVTNGPSLTALSCRPGCVARPAEGNDALKRSSVPAAFDAYRCADTPEAAFGAGLTTVIAAASGESTNRVLADLGHTGIKSTDLIGPSGWFARFGTRWNGSGSITRSDPGGAVLETAALSRGRQLASDGGYTSARFLGTTDLARVTLSWNGTGPVTAGQRLGMGCSAGGISYPSVSFSSPQGTCSSSSRTCDPAAGAIVVTKPGAAVGDTVEYTLEDVLVTCSPRGSGSAGVPARLKGSFRTTIAPAKVDLAGLHPLITGEEAFGAKLPAGVTLERTFASAAGIAGSLELASCYFDAAGAGAGDGKVFEVPSEVFGGPPIAVSRGDARILSAFAALAASAIVLVQAYKLPIELRGLLCTGSEGTSPCITRQEAAARLNAGIGALADRQKIEIARRLVRSALASLADAGGGIGPASFFVKDARSAATVDRLQAMAAKLLESLDKGSVPLPFVTPDLKVDLKMLFDSPPDPDKIAVDPIAYDAERNSLEVVEAFVDQAVPASAIPWSNKDRASYQITGGNLDLEVMSLRLEGYFPF